MTANNTVYIVMVTLLLLGRCNPHAQASAQELAGEWRGSMQGSGTYATMQLTLTQSGNNWGADLSITSDHGKLTPRVTDLVVEHAQISFTVLMHGGEVWFTGDLEGEYLSGSIEALRHDGERVTAGSWKLSRLGTS